MKDVTGVEYKRLTYLVWWRMWQVYSTKDCDLPGLIKGMTGIQKTDLPGLMKDVTGVQYKRLWPTWSDEGCDRCTVQKTVTNLDWWRTWQVNKRLWPTWTDEGGSRRGHVEPQPLGGGGRHKGLRGGGVELGVAGGVGRQQRPWRRDEGGWRWRVDLRKAKQHGVSTRLRCSRTRIVTSKMKWLQYGQQQQHSCTLCS